MHYFLGCWWQSSVYCAWLSLYGYLWNLCPVPSMCFLQSHRLCLAIAMHRCASYFFGIFPFSFAFSCVEEDERACLSEGKSSLRKFLPSSSSGFSPLVAPWREECSASTRKELLGKITSLIKDNSPDRNRMCSSGPPTLASCQAARCTYFLWHWVQRHCRLR